VSALDLQPSALEALVGQRMPSDILGSTRTESVVLAEHPNLVIYLYPGAAGIIRGDETPLIDAAQHRGFQTHLASFTASGFTVVGLSSQSGHRQRQSAHRHRLLHALVSDPNFCVAEALGLPTLRLGAARVYERLTLVVAGGSMRLVLSPLPTPESHPAFLAELLRRKLQR
jgi:peroxiredoxin